MAQKDAAVSSESYRRARDSVAASRGHVLRSLGGILNAVRVCDCHFLAPALRPGVGTVAGHVRLASLDRVGRVSQMQLPARAGCEFLQCRQVVQSARADAHTQKSAT